MKDSNEDIVKWRAKKLKPSNLSVINSAKHFMVYWVNPNPNAPIQDKYLLICLGLGIGCVPLCSFLEIRIWICDWRSHDHSTWKEWSCSRALKEFQKVCYFKGAFLWEDPDLDLWSKITQIIVHKRNRVLDELSENSKKCKCVKTFVCIWVTELFPEWLVLLQGLLACNYSLEAHFFMVNSNDGIKTEASIDYDMGTWEWMPVISGWSI